MKRWFFWIFLFLAAGCAACHSAPREAAKPQPIVLLSSPSPAANEPIIVAFGDSLTVGYGLLSTQSYPSLLEEKLRADGYDYKVINAGVTGDTSAAGLQRLDKALEGSVKLVIVELGGNDILQGQPIAETKNNLRQIIERIKARNAEVLLAGLYAPQSASSTYQKQVREAYQTLASEHNVTLIPFLLDRVAGVASLNLDDGLHPNAEGTKIVAETVFRALRPMLEKEERRSSKTPPG